VKIVPVILSGGAGSRLWPLSRELSPKPFIELPEGGTLIGETYRRAAAIAGVDHVVTVTNRELLFRTTDEYDLVPSDGIAQSFLLEPFGRDTAAAIALATHYSARSGDPVLLAMPADHRITGNEAFREAASMAAAKAEAGRVVAFGIRPDRPETGFGYLEIEGGEVSRFVEKPDAATAMAYLASGRHFWNSGIFCFRASVMLEAMRRFCPGVSAKAAEAIEKGRVSHSAQRTSIEVDAASFAETPAISIDYAVMEKLGRMGFVAAEFGWSDVGSWSAIAEFHPQDENGNRVTGEVLLNGAERCYVHGHGRLVGLSGVSDLVVVDTADALLVTHRDRSQDVKAIYQRLKEARHEAALIHRKVHRPWGSYTVIETGERFKIKRIEVKPGGRLSLQAHDHRSEHWVVVSGTAVVTNGDTEYVLSSDQSTYVARGTRHRLENKGSDTLVLIEVQSGDYLGEDDIVRFDDIYGRR